MSGAVEKAKATSEDAIFSALPRELVCNRPKS